MTANLHAEELWWKNAVLYSLDVETYMDGNGDGVGDFIGLTRRLDHLASLGVTCLWLMPFYPTSGDDGYAVTDYYTIDPRLGTLGDFVTFRRAAGDRGMRVVVDIVANHTSDRHPWFEESRSSRDSPKRDWYVWTDEPIEAARGEVFPGEQDGNFVFDEGTGQYYFHRFHPFQPDLNMSNPEVRLEVLQIMGFWLELGVDGFRIDAAPFMAETQGLHGPAGEAQHQWLKEVHAFVDHRRGDSVIVGEANLPPEEIRPYFGDGDELQLLFNFSQNASLFLALATGSGEPLRRHLEGLPEIPLSCGWLNFVRLHDELNLDRLDDEQRQIVFERFGPEEHMQIYDRGLRRRVAPMLGDRRWLQLTYSLAFSLPGMPLIYYGDEIGMGENLDMDGRMAVRTPMRWDDGPAAGFSIASEADLIRPLSHETDPAETNVLRQRHDKGSLLSWMRDLVDARRQHPAIGLGRPEFFDTGSDSVLGHCCVWQGDAFVALHNLSNEAFSVAAGSLPVGSEAMVTFSDDGDRGPIPDTIELDGHGYRWLHVRGEPGSHAGARPPHSGAAGSRAPTPP